MLSLSTEPPFPTLSAVSTAQSDELVFPVRVQPHAQCIRTILAAKRDGHAIINAASADRLIGAIIQSNAYNTGWVSRNRYRNTDSRPLNSARRYWRTSLM